MRATNIAIIILLALLCQTAGAQILFNPCIPAQHWNKRLLFNPATAAYEQKNVITTTGSVSMDGVGNYFLSSGTATYEHSLNKNFGLAGLVNYRSNGETFYAIRQTEAGIALSRQFIISEKSVLRAGVMASCKYLEKHLLYQPQEGTFFKGYLPDMAAGVWYSNGEFFAGASAVNLLQNKLTFNTEVGRKITQQEKANSYLTTGYTFFNDKPLAWRLTFLGGTDLSRTIIDVNNTLIFKKRYSVGASVTMERIKYFSVNAGVLLGERFEMSLASTISDRNNLLVPGYADVVLKYKL